MTPMAWIFFVYCLVSYVQYSRADSSACDTAVTEYNELVDSSNRVLDNITTIFGLTPYENYSVPSVVTNKEHGTVKDLCAQLKLLAQAAKNVIIQCSHSSEQCRNRWNRVFAPDVLRAAAKFCENFRAEEYIQHAKTLVPCGVSHALKFSKINRTVDEERTRIFRLWFEETKAAELNSTVSCGFACGRECACRGVQIQVPFHTNQPDASMREICGQNAHDLVLELQKRVLDALNCSEFGDYVKEWGWLKVNYQANKTTTGE